MLKAICKAPTSREQSVVHECRIADTDSARLWLAEGGPVADVLTMLEVRRRLEFSPHDCRAYAVEILSAARGKIHTTNQLHVAHRKEPKNAVA